VKGAIVIARYGHGWRGALGITYHVGPGPALVHLKVAAERLRRRRARSRPATLVYQRSDDVCFRRNPNKTGVIVNLAPVLCATDRYARSDEHPRARGSL